MLCCGGSCGCCGRVVGFASIRMSVAPVWSEDVALELLVDLGRDHVIRIQLLWLF